MVILSVFLLWSREWRLFCFFTRNKTKKNHTFFSAVTDETKKKTAATIVICHVYCFYPSSKMVHQHKRSLSASLTFVTALQRTAALRKTQKIIVLTALWREIATCLTGHVYAYLVHENLPSTITQKLGFLLSQFLPKILCRTCRWQQDIIGCQVVLWR